MWKVDPQHTGLNSHETVLTPAIVADSTKFAPLFFQKLDGQVYGAPLFVSAATLNGLPGGFKDGKSHNVVYVVTQHDSVYAFDADADPLGANTSGTDSAPLWHTSFLQSNPQLGTPTTVPYTDAAGNDINPELGITATPVIDPTSGTLFVVSLLKFPGQPVNNLYRQELHALDLKTGLDKVPPFVLDASVTFKGFVTTDSSNPDNDPVTAPAGEIPFAPLHEHLRGAMTFDAVNKLVYLVYASHSDQPRYYGLVLGFSFNGSSLQLAHSFVTTPNGATVLDPTKNGNLTRGGGKGGIWQGGASAALDQNQNIIFVTGNGPFDQDPNTGSADWGESVVKLPAAMNGEAQYQLSATDTGSYFTPSNWATLNSGGGSIPGDSDLGAGGPLLLPAQRGSHPDLVMFGGKAGVWYLADRDILGGLVANDPQIIQELPEPRAPQLTITPSYFNGAVYYASSGSPMVKRTLNYDSVNDVTTLSTTPVVGTGPNINAKGATPFITSNGTANGIIWGLDGNLRAYDAGTMQLLSSSFVNDITAPDGSGRCQTTKFSTMIVANAHAYYTCYSGTSQGFLVVAGLKSAAAATPAAPSALAAQTVSATAINLTWTNNAASDPSLAGFHIFRATSASGPFTQLSTPAQGTSFSDATVAPNTQYFYKVTAYNSVGDSAPAGPATATTYPTYAQGGLVAYWPMEDGPGSTVADATGKGHTGSVQANSEALYTSAGYINGGWAFHGTNISDSIIVQDSADLDFSATQSFTLATWVEVDNLTSLEQPIVLKSANAGNVYGLLVNSNNQFAMRGPSGDVAGPAVVKGVWAHVALVQNGAAGTRTLYVNGQAVAQGAAQAANGTGTLEWGEEDLPAGSNQVQHGFQGRIDETRLYNTALSTSQIADLLPVTLLDVTSVLASGTPDQLGTTLFPVTAPVSEARVSRTAGSYTVVAHFAKAVTGIAASLTQQSGAAAQGSVGTITYDGTRTVVSIPLSSVADGQKLNLHLSGIVASDNTSVIAGAADIALTVLEGDVTGDGVVDNNDVSLETNSITNAAVTTNNARFDINGDGSLTSADTSLVSSRTPGGSTPPPPGTDVIAIDCGSTTAVSSSRGTFVADGAPYVTAGGPFPPDTATITIPSAISSVAAPAAVYQTARQGNSFSYTIPGLVANSTNNKVILHFAELYFPTANSRVFNIQVGNQGTNGNGMQLVQNFDIYAAASANLPAGANAKNTAVVEIYNNIAADSSGNIIVSFSSIGKDQPLVNGIEVQNGSSGSTPPAAPPPPVVSQPTATSSQVNLTWASSQGATSYLVFRGTTANGESTVAIGNSTTTSYVDSTNLVSGTTYYYYVEASNGTSSGPSNEVHITVPAAGGTGADVVAVNAGSSAAVSSSSGNTFQAETSYVNGGSDYAPNPTIVIPASEQSVAAPAQVYQSSRQGSPITFTLPGFSKNSTGHTVVLHFAELYHTAPGTRVFNFQVGNQSSGMVSVSNFDIYAAAAALVPTGTSAKNTAVVETYNNITADANGNITVTFVGGNTGNVDQPMIEGLEAR